MKRIPSTKDYEGFVIVFPHSSLICLPCYQTSCLHIHGHSVVAILLTLCLRVIPVIWTICFYNLHGEPAKLWDGGSSPTPHSLC